MNNKQLYNNIGIAALGLAFVIPHSSPMSVSKALLILPFITHRELLDYLANGNVKVSGLEKLIIEKTSFFTNFNRRYYDNICSTLNGIQLLNDIEIVQLKDSSLVIEKPIAYEEAMGRRAQKVYKASKNIALALADNLEKLYLNLRIEL